jgi:hypothetical protein
LSPKWGSRDSHPWTSEIFQLVGLLRMTPLGGQREREREYEEEEERRGRRIEDIYIAFALVDVEKYSVITAPRYVTT